MKKNYVILLFCLFYELCGGQNAMIIDYNDSIDNIRVINNSKLSYNYLIMLQQLHNNTKIIYDTLGVDSVMIEFYDNGLVGHICPYKNGQLHGFVEVFYPNGQLEVRSRYIEGKYVDKYEMRFEFDGSIRKEGFIKDGEQDGIWYYYLYGYLSEKRYYKNGKEYKRKFWNNKIKKWVNR